jgi:hypothetical protein
VRGERDRKAARIEVRVSSAQLTRWRAAARARKLELAAFVRHVVDSASDRVLPLPAKRVLPQAQRAHSRQGCTGLGKSK